MTNKKVRMPPDQRRGRPVKFGLRIERQVSVGIDPLRARQLLLVQQHLQKTSAGTVTESDVFRNALDRLVASLLQEVPELKS